jgi:hypothetical protein
MNRADGEGGDLGGTNVSPAKDEQVEPKTNADTSADDSGIEKSESASKPESSGEDAATSELPTDKPASPKMLALLDAISADKPKAVQVEEPNEGKKEDAAGADQSKATPPKQAEKIEKTDTEEAELLAGVKSERGKDRIRQVFAEKKQLEQDMTEFKQLVQGTGMTPQDFAQTLEFGRLVNSGDEKDVRVALEMLESQRAMLYQRLGVEAPGVDLLEGHEDLKQAVDNMEITRERAVELAKFRKSEAQKVQQQKNQTESMQRQQQIEQTVQQAAGAMEAYLSTRANEVDHPARMKIIAAHFQNPENLQAFITTYEPHQWAATIKIMYDGIVVKPHQPHDAQPLRSRPATLGAPSAQGTTPVERLAQRLDNMGI